MTFPGRHHRPATARDDFDVVLVGSGLGVYALTRAFHEQYGIVSTVVTRVGIGPLRKTVTARTIELGAAADDAAMVRALLELAARRPEDRPALLLCNADSVVQFLSDHREELEPHYRMPLLEAETLDRLSDKAEFSQLCEQLGIDTPATHIADFSAAGDEGWEPDVVSFPFPVVAKAAKTSEYAHVRFPGKKKVFFLHDAAELRELFTSLAGAGFRGRFLVQELVPGDDTCMRSLTAYRDLQGRVTLMSSAQVLLEEHTPDALGRPCAMITIAMPEATDAARRLLDASGYTGYANFDLKQDPRDGSLRFFEVNPRIGRNNHYVTAAGANVARAVVADHIDGQQADPVRTEREILYSLVPLRMLLRYVVDPEQRRWVRSVARRGIANPWIYRAEGLWMHLYAQVAKLNHVRKFRQFYPEPTDSGF